MTGRLTLSIALAMVVLGTAPGWAMSTTTMPSNRGTTGFTDPANKPQKRVSGTAQSFGTYNGGAFGFGGSASVSVGQPRFPMQSDPGTPFTNPSFPFANPAFQTGNPAFSDFPTNGALADPTFGPNGEYAPRFNSKR